MSTDTQSYEIYSTNCRHYKITVVITAVFTLLRGGVRLNILTLSSLYIKKTIRNKKDKNTTIIGVRRGTVG